jgi:hypothetical protein
MVTYGQGRRLQAHPATIGRRAHLLLAQAQPPLDGALEAIAIIAVGFAKLALISVMLKVSNVNF